MMHALRTVAFSAAGTTFLALGIAGLFLPLLPTTPFLLAASACYARGSTRLHRWLLGHRRLGPIVTAFEAGRGLPRRAKILALVSLSVSMAFAIPSLAAFPAQVALAGIALLVAAWIAGVPTAG
jgi:uncharacterized membrane protein YbaN (DUF454 family)